MRSGPHGLSGGQKSKVPLGLMLELKPATLPQGPRRPWGNTVIQVTKRAFP